MFAGEFAMKKREKTTTPKRTTFGERLQIAQDARGINTYQLDKKTSASKTVIGRYRRDEVVPRIDRVSEFAEALEVSYLWLSQGTGPMQPESTGASMVLAPENLRKLSTDLQTVREAVKKVEQHQQVRQKKLTPGQVSDTVALLCLFALRPEQNTVDEEIIQFLEEIDLL